MQNKKYKKDLNIKLITSDFGQQGLFPLGSHPCGGGPDIDLNKTKTNVNFVLDLINRK